MRLASVLSLLILPTSVIAQTAFIERIQTRYENVCYFTIDDKNKPPELNLDDAFSYLTLGGEQEITATVFNPMFAKCGDRDAQLCGTRGCDIIIEVGQKSYQFTGWTPTAIKVNGEAMLLVPHSGWMCGDALPNNAPCYTIAAWDDYAQKLNYTTLR